MRLSRHWYRNQAALSYTKHSGLQAFRVVVYCLLQTRAWCLEVAPEVPTFFAEELYLQQFVNRHEADYILKDAYALRYAYTIDSQWEIHYNTLNYDIISSKGSSRPQETPRVTSHLFLSNNVTVQCSFAIIAAFHFEESHGLDRLQVTTVSVSPKSLPKQVVGRRLSMAHFVKLLAASPKYYVKFDSGADKGSDFNPLLISMSSNIHHIIDCWKKTRDLIEWGVDTPFVN